MSEKKLTREIAEQFHEDPHSVDLNSYDEITEEAVEVLSKFYYFNDKKLTYLTAVTLSRYNGLIEINDEIKADSIDPIIANHKGGLRYEIYELSEIDAKKLSYYKGKLDLYEIDTLSENAAKKISKHNGGELDFNGPVNRTWSVIGSIYPYGVKFDSNIISILSSYEGALSLGIKSLDSLKAEALTKHEGDLYLPYLYMISDKAASLLMKHKGDINNLTPEKFLSSLERQNPIIDITVAKKFIDQGGCREERYFCATIELEDYHEITTEAMNHLMENQDKIDFENENFEFDLSGLLYINTNVAQALSKYEYATVNLNGLKLINDAVAQSLSALAVDLILGITEISNTAAEYLSQHQGRINDMDPKAWIQSLKNNE